MKAFHNHREQNSKRLRDACNDGVTERDTETHEPRPATVQSVRHLAFSTNPQRHAVRVIVLLEYTMLRVGSRLLEMSLFRCLLDESSGLWRSCDTAILTKQTY